MAPRWWLAPIAAAAIGACQNPGGVRQTARASDEWTRTLPLDAHGELRILNTSGSVDIEGATTDAVEVHAERIAHATSDQAARDLLTHIGIHDTSEAGRLTVETERIGGVLIGVSFAVNYHVKVPAAALIRTRTADGTTTITGTTGRVIVSGVNGAVVGRAIAGGIEARTTNGKIDVELLKVGDEVVDLRTMNGAIGLTIPVQANATLAATSVNGTVDVTGLAFEKFGDDVRRRVRGRINQGGTPIDLNAVNGDIRVRARE